MNFGLRGQNPQSKIHNPKSALVAGFVSLLFLAQCLALALPGFVDSIRYERRYLAGKSQLERGDYQGALASFMGAAEIDRVCACLYRDIGLAYAGLNQHDKERASYNVALSREEHDWRTRALLSDSLRAAGDPHAANPISLTRPEFRAEQQRWSWDHLTPPTAPVVDVGAADIGYVMGFESSESEGEINYRWSTAQSYVRLTYPSGVGKVQMVIRWHSLAWPGKQDPNAIVRFAADGRQVGTLTAHSTWGEATLGVPDGQQGNITVIELLAPVARPPGSDTRLLGVAVDSIGLARVK